MCIDLPHPGSEIGDHPALSIHVQIHRTDRYFRTGTRYSRGLVKSKTALLTRVLLKIQNACGRTVFAHVSKRIDAVMHIRRQARIQVRLIFATEQVSSRIN